jgi:hypothetical protein
MGNILCYNQVKIGEMYELLHESRGFLWYQALPNITFLIKLVACKAEYGLYVTVNNGRCRT